MKNSAQEGVENPDYPVDQEQESPDEALQQDAMVESMQQGLNMLKGLFGN